MVLPGADVHPARLRRIRDGARDLCDGIARRNVRWRASMADLCRQRPMLLRLACPPSPARNAVHGSWP